MSSLIYFKAKNEEKIKKVYFFVHASKYNFAPLWGPNKNLISFKYSFWRLFFEAKGRFLQKMNIHC